MTVPKIILTPQEDALFRRLREAAEAHGLTLRAAGGWVRDKLLGYESHDIDIAIDKMTGTRFAREVLNLPAHVMDARPEQSKHLETACVKVEGVSVDLVNLRDESYGGYDDGRILSENRFGTPKIDAERRDFTVNALFLNLHTLEVEDYVGGVYDLGFFDGKWQRKTLLRTPLEPLRTFLDDPLRPLRAVRFFSKLPHALIDSKTEQAMADPAVHEALRTKVSWERVAVELIGQAELVNGTPQYKGGILSGRNAVPAIELMAETGLLDVVLDVPAMKDFAPFKMDQQSSHHAFNVLEHSLRVMSALQEHPFVRKLHRENPERGALLMFDGLCHDLGKRDPKIKVERGDGWCSYVGHEEVSAEVARDICNKLRLSNDATDYVVRVCRHHMDPHGREWGDRDATLRRFMNKLPDCWEDVIVHAYCDVVGTGTERSDAEYARYGQKIERCRWLLANDPNPATNAKPPLDGQIIMALVPQMKQGPWIRDTVKRLTEYKFEHPHADEAELTALVEEWAPAILADPQYAKFLK